jgi:superfamily II DNA helicase RecQ
LPPPRQREFEEAMQLQNPLYIRASSHRLSVQYSVIRVKNGRRIAKVEKLVTSRWQGMAKDEKGVVYCTSHAKCKALAQQLGCHYYHGLPSDIRESEQFVTNFEKTRLQISGVNIDFLDE